MTVIQPLDPLRERALLLTLAGIQFAHILDFMVMMPLGPILVREFGIGTHEFGLLVSASPSAAPPPACWRPLSSTASRGSACCWACSPSSRWLRWPAAWRRASPS
ncbi:MAG: hypothetical protein M5R42_21685 [Rhodocyclaceae bacterium]|nr:hypothetical protein [Rhodocyclaceae bacterium]